MPGEHAEGGPEAQEHLGASVSPETAALNEELRERGERLRQANAAIEAAFGDTYGQASEVQLDDRDQPVDVPADGEWHRFGSGPQEGDAGLVAVTLGEDGSRTEETFARGTDNTWHYMYEHTPAGSTDVIVATVNVGSRSGATVHADGRMTKMGWSQGGEQRPPHPYTAEDEEDAAIRGWLAERVKGQSGADFRSLENRQDAS